MEVGRTPNSDDVIRHQVVEVILDTLSKLDAGFAPDELAYLSLTSKPEFIVRDQIAWRIHKELGPDLAVAREWNPGKKGLGHRDLAVLVPGVCDPILLLELKAMYTFDGVKTNREQYPCYVEADIGRSFSFAGVTTDIYALLLAVHPLQALPPETKGVAKYRGSVNAALRRRDPFTLRRECYDFLSARLPRIAALRVVGSVHAGRAFGVPTELLYWLLGPVRRPLVPIV